MQRIRISKELRDYIEKLNFEAIRCQDLLQTIKREFCPMTDEEWHNSLKYFKNMNAEAQYCFRIAMDEIYEIYKDLIGDNPWHINFTDCVIVVGSTSSEPLIIQEETYNEKLRRLYPDAEQTSLAINGTYTKDITLQVTDACNMACTYCYQHNKGTHKMSFEVAKNFIDMILDADERTNTYITSTKCDGVIINLIGGEPWLEVDLIDKVSDYFIGELFRRKHPWATKFVFDICSNGLLHFDPRVQAYLKKHISHLGYNISIDGNKDLHDSCRVDLMGNGTYDRAIAGVKNFTEVFKGYMGSKMTIAPGNVDKVFDAVAFMIGDSGYKNINLNCVYEEGWTVEHARTLYWQLHQLTNWLHQENLLDKTRLSLFTEQCGKPLTQNDTQNWCGGTGLMLAVDYKGDIFPCLRYMESSVNNKVPAYVIGNVDDGINKKQEHCERIQCLSCITRQSQSTQECIDCPIAMGCGWCSAYNYETFGTPNKRATYICHMHKARVLANVYYWRLRGVDYPMNCPKEWAVEIIGEEEYEKLNSMKVGETLCL